MFDFYSAAPTYERLRQKAEDMYARYAGRLSVGSIGRSWEGREILSLTVGEPRGGALFVGGTHGAEWLTVLAAVRFAEDWLAGDLPYFGGHIPEAGCTVVPCLNPDGTERAISGQGEQPWQANARGVDLNHNFDAGWKKLRRMERRAGITGPGPTRFGGAEPFSEPESRAIAGLCRDIEPRSLYALHSQGEEIYWRYGSQTPARSRLMAEILADASGYAVADPSGTASHGGLKDWFIETTGRPGFTLEIGRGRNPLPISDFPALYAGLKEALCLAAVM